MSEWKVARRYANALFRIALEKGELEPVAEGMRFIRSTLEGSPELVHALVHPVLAPSIQHRVVAEVFKGRLPATLGRFLAFLEEKKRLMILRAVTGVFDELVKEQQGVIEGRLLTARPLSDERKAALERGLSSRFGSTYRLRAETKPELMGGFSLMVRDRIYDCSIENQLKRLREKLVGTG